VRVTEAETPLPGNVTSAWPEIAASASATDYAFGAESSNAYSFTRTYYEGVFTYDLAVDGDMLKLDVVFDSGTNEPDTLPCPDLAPAGNVYYRGARARVTCSGSVSIAP
jgi:hypothetical protein